MASSDKRARTGANTGPTTRVGWMAIPTLVAACLVGACGSDGARGFGGAGTGGQSSPVDGGGTGGNLGSGGSGGQTGGGGANAAGSGGTGSAGHAGTGGIVGTGGTGTAGRSGTGGGSGGVLGSGGRIGTGGVGSGGSLGTGGAPNAATCDSIAAAYQQALPGAKVCLNALDRLPCAQQVPARLGCSGNCTTFVDSTATLDPIRQQWTTLGCDNVPRVCSLIACLPPTGATCATAVGATTGTCQDITGIITTANGS